MCITTATCFGLDNCIDSCVCWPIENAERCSCCCIRNKLGCMLHGEYLCRCYVSYQLELSVGELCRISSGELSSGWHDTWFSECARPWEYQKRYCDVHECHMLRICRADGHCGGLAPTSLSWKDEIDLRNHQAGFIYPVMQLVNKLRFSRNLVLKLYSQCPLQCRN